MSKNKVITECTCCPFGYHIERDFVNFCEALANSQEDGLGNTSDYRKNRKRWQMHYTGNNRKKQMDTMLGLSSSNTDNCPVSEEKPVESRNTNALIITEELKKTKNDENKEHQLSINELENSRNNMIEGLKKIKDLEAQLKEIPLLKLRLAVLEDEKRILELKLLNSTPQVIHRNIITNVPLIPQRKSPVQLVGLNETLKKVKDIGIATNSIFKRDIACSTFSINQKSIGLDPILFEPEQIKEVIEEVIKPILVSIATETDLFEEDKAENSKENIPVSDNSTQCDLTNIVKISRSVQFSPNVVAKSTQYIKNIQHKSTDTSGVIVLNEKGINTDIRETKSISINTIPPVEKVLQNKGTDTIGIILSKESSSNTDIRETKSISINTSVIRHNESSTQTDSIFENCKIVHSTEDEEVLKEEVLKVEILDIQDSGESLTTEQDFIDLNDRDAKLIEINSSERDHVNVLPVTKEKQISSKILQRQSTFTVQETPALSISPMTVVSTSVSIAEEQIDDQIPIRMPSPEMISALHEIQSDLHDHSYKACSRNFIETEWFDVSSSVTANFDEVKGFLRCFENISPEVLNYVVNLQDENGNSALHYAISHGNFRIVNLLLQSKQCNVNVMNNAGYTPVMLVSLATLKSLDEISITSTLFNVADVNIKAKKHGQTALMLAISHGNIDMVSNLLEAGADINIQDEDGSTGLMCAVEHGRIDIVKMLLSHPDCDSTIHDIDGSTALKIALDAGYRDIGLLLYAHSIHSRIT